MDKSDVYVFTSAKNGAVYAVTRDISGTNLPEEFAPWCAGDANGMSTEGNPALVREMGADGFLVINTDEP